jgi:hypothetical protein
MIDSAKLIGATIDLDFDFPRISEEILACRDLWKYARPNNVQIEDGIAGRTPFMSESRSNYERLEYYDTKMAETKSGEFSATRRMYLRTYDGFENPSFLVTKTVHENLWRWSDEIATLCPYTIECIESLPIGKLGAVCCLIMEDTFLPTHRDFNTEQKDYHQSRSLGLSLIPETGGVGTQIWHPVEKKRYEIKGNCTVFNDAMYHGTSLVPRRIILRIFGEIDWQKILSKAVPESVITL